MREPTLVLASQSPRRRELVQVLGLPFEVTVACVQERPLADETPAELVERLSREKARHANLNDHRDALVLGCDTVVALREPGSDSLRILGKPRDRQEAVAMLRRLRGRRHVVYSGATVVNPTGSTASQLARTELVMRAYDPSEMAVYVASGDPLDKAGGYAIQHEGFHPVREIDGCYASVMGLPLCHVVRCLRRLGHSPGTDVPMACQAHTGRPCSVHQEILKP